MTVIRLLVCGSRNYTNRARLYAVLDAIHRKHAIEVLIEGECPEGGADKMSREWAESRGVPVDPCPVDHALDGPWPGAGPRRNTRQLVEKKPTHCTAFPTRESRGTWDMVRQFNDWPGKQAPAWVIPHHEPAPMKESEE